MDAQAVSPHSNARYAGYLRIGAFLPPDHPAFSKDPDGDPIPPRAVVVPLGQGQVYDSFADAVAAARAASAGGAPALAIVQTPGDTKFAVEQLLIKAVGKSKVPFDQRKYQPINLQDVPYVDKATLLQPKLSQEQVVIHSIIDGDKTFDVELYHSAR